VSSFARAGSTIFDDLLFQGEGIGNILKKLPDKYAQEMFVGFALAEFLGERLTEISGSGILRI